MAESIFKVKLPENAAEQRRALLTEIETQEAAVEKAAADYKAAEVESEPFRKRMRSATDRAWKAKTALAQARSDLTKILAFTAEDSMRAWVKDPAGDAATPPEEAGAS